ncbi:hypothetical protein ES332_A03G104100v1 [Gossypium tomentosum]|uniref:Secreted protein n=1 Tax=Gossypium tomentosum TaxID=34277 RepID=A0A5D2R4R3_GOSTO|nr:hypothetical protein ES332_A03G104100v1 [Gossypium tomentosum]
MYMRYRSKLRMLILTCLIRGISSCAKGEMTSTSTPASSYVSLIAFSYVSLTKLNAKINSKNYTSRLIHADIARKVPTFHPSHTFILSF